MKQSIVIFFLLLTFLPFLPNAENGSKLWLRTKTESNAIITAKQELKSQWKGAPVQLNILNNKELRKLGKDGYLITGDKLTSISISASTEQGLLYGAYH